MGMILTGIVVAIAIAIGASYLLDTRQVASWDFFTSSSVRVDDPGNNLVGPDWSGENSVPPNQST